MMPKMWKHFCEPLEMDITHSNDNISVHGANVFTFYHNSVKKLMDFHEILYEFHAIKGHLTFGLFNILP
jgi:hypothetical protein